MTSLSRRRWIAPSIALTLAAGTVGALASPASAATTTFTQGTDIFIGSENFSPENTAPITINDDTTATPYGSPIEVTHAGAITDVDVRLWDITHSFNDDIDVLLVGPGGQQVTLMSDAGDGFSMAGKDLTFNDEAGGDLPAAGAFSSSTYRPTNYSGTDSFPSPAPDDTGNTSLSVFDGTSPVGTWNLYVVDDEGIGGGEIAGGWDLLIDQQTTSYPSTIAVSGLPPVSDVNVRLGGVSSTYLDDIDLLLVGPGGQQSTIMSDAGDGFVVNGLNLTIDDEAAAAFPDEGTEIVSGAYRPSNYSTLTDGYDAPAPDSNGETPLSVFDGLSPNGVWSLYAMDNAGGDVTVIRDWSLDFAWTDTLSPTGTVNVNGGASSTSAAAVTLSLSATDPAPASGVKEMHFSNDGVTWSAYQPYATSAAWTLTAGDGAKTVYAQFRDADGNQSAVASDTITLALPDTTSPTVTKTTPKNNAKGVKVTTKVKVAVSEALLGSSVNKNTVVLKAKGSSKKVKAKVTYNAAKKRIILTPTKNLKKGTKYKVTVSTKVKDAAGNAFDAKPTVSGAQALKFSFTTA